MNEGGEGLIALYIILGLIALIVLVLSVRAKVHVQYEGSAVVDLQWLFLTIPLFPRPETEKKPKKKKEKKPEEEKPEEEKPEEEKPKKEKGGPNPIKQVLADEGFDGIWEILSRFAVLTDKFGNRFARSFIIHTMTLDLRVTGGDAAETAIEYGKWCRKIFPVAGCICSMCKVREYAVNVYPDFIAQPGVEPKLELTVGLIPRKVINSLVMYVVGIINRIGLRLVKDLIHAIRHPAEPKAKTPKPGGDAPAEAAEAPKKAPEEKKKKKKKKAEPEPEPEPPEINWPGRVRPETQEITTNQS